MRLCHPKRGRKLLTIRKINSSKFVWTRKRLKNWIVWLLNKIPIGQR
nr:MAG TPA: hypothetical protein [Caudoviricetes sp.]